MVEKKIKKVRVIEEVSENELEKVSLDKPEKSGMIRRRKRAQDGFQLKLDIEDKYLEPGWVYRWFKGTPQRLGWAEANDWSFVEDAELAREKHSDGTSRVNVLVGSTETGSARRDYLMRMPEDWFREYQQDKEKPREEMEKAIRRGDFHQIEEGAKYAPKNEIKLERR